MASKDRWNLDQTYKERCAKVFSRQGDGKAYVGF